MTRPPNGMYEEETEEVEDHEVVEEIEEIDGVQEASSGIPSAPSRTSSRSNGVNETIASKRSSTIIVASTSPPVRQSSDPLAMSGGLSTTSSPVRRPTKRKLDVLKGRARLLSEPESDESSDLTPHIGNRRQSTKGDRRSKSEVAPWNREVMVEIPFVPLDELRQYGVSSSLQLPSRSSRRRVIEDQKAPSTFSEAESSSSRTASPPSRGARSQRAAAVEVETKRYPTWRVTSSPPMNGEMYSEEDEDDASDEEDEEEYSDDELVILRTSKRARNDHSSKRRAKSPIRTRASRPTRKSRETSRMAQPKRGRERISSSEDDEDFQSEGEDELDDDSEDELLLDSESDFEDDKKRGKPKGKPAQREKGLFKRHRAFCEKCKREPADQMMEKFVRAQKRGTKRRKNDEDRIPEDELAERLEGWLKCKSCCISSHWGCLGPDQCREVLWDIADVEGPPREGEKKRRSVKIDETFEFTCARCTSGAGCMVCHKGPKPSSQEEDAKQSVEPETEAEGEEKEQTDKTPKAIMFRCFRCKQSCHYDHLRSPFEEGEKYDLDDIAEHYQNENQGNDQWQCHQCRDWIWGVDIICAWRPSPADAVDIDSNDKPNPKTVLRREYLVKWVGRGFRHVTWVPHAWLMVVAMQKLRNFLEKGPSLDLITDETLAAHGDEMEAPTIANLLDEGTNIGQGRGKGKADWKGYGPAPDVNGVSAIPPEWMTIDRVLDVCLTKPPTQKKPVKPHLKGNRILSLSPSASVEPDAVTNQAQRHPDGLEPPEDDKIPIDEWEVSTGRVLTEKDTEDAAKMVTWCFVKWDDLQYDQSCWDTPPPVDSPFYEAFKKALGRYLKARQVNIPVLTDAQIKRREVDAARQRTPPQSQPDCIVGGKLMDFQMQGFQWLLFKHFKRESCILADDMGLGKTIQIASLLGYLGSEELEIYPVLVIVPNSTITNWVREFEKWVPHMRVVPFYGEKSSRKVIMQYELYHKGMQGKAAGLKAHVVLTTYDMITSADFRTFASVPRWEVVCVDEGQRLKSDSNLIFNNLKKLNSVHRILLTGTPLNNNLRELFNLLNFLDSETFRHLQDLEERFTNLNEGLIQELHNMIRPYILRRIKADVLKLPPKVEIIVPISLSPLQKNVYKGILERNANVLKAIAEAKMNRGKAKAKKINGGGGGMIVNGEKEKDREKEQEQAQVSDTIMEPAEKVVAATATVSAHDAVPADTATNTDAAATTTVDGPVIVVEDQTTATEPSHSGAPNDIGSPVDPAADESAEVDGVDGVI